MKIPTVVTLENINLSLINDSNVEDIEIVETENSVGEYGMGHYKGSSPTKKRAFKDKIGAFIDIGDGYGVRLLLSNEDIKWIHKQFLLMQFARDDFVVKFSIQCNLSP